MSFELSHVFSSQVEATLDILRLEIIKTGQSQLNLCFLISKSIFLLSHILYSTLNHVGIAYFTSKRIAEHELEDIGVLRVRNKTLVFYKVG